MGEGNALFWVLVATHIEVVAIPSRFLDDDSWSIVLDLAIVTCQLTKMTNDRRIDPEARRAALVLLAKGEATMAEVAQLAGISRQVVRYWAEVAGIDWSRARTDRLARAWRKALLHRG